MTWEEIAHLHRDGFEVGNHTRDHIRSAARTSDGSKNRSRRSMIAVPNSACPVRPSSPIRATGSIRGRADSQVAGMQIRRSGQRTPVFVKEGRGFAYEPGLDHPLLIPSAGDARPGLDARGFQTGRQPGPVRTHRRVAISRRARPGSRVGALPGRAIRGVHELPRRPPFSRDRVGRSRTVRRSCQHPVQPAGRHPGSSTFARGQDDAQELTRRKTTPTSAAGSRPWCGITASPFPRCTRRRDFQRRQSTRPWSGLRSAPITGHRVSTMSRSSFCLTRAAAIRGSAFWTGPFVRNERPS